MPGHSGCFQDRDSTANIILDILEVHYTSIIVILSREQCPLETSGMNVSEWMVVRVPATVTEIDTADGGDVVIHYHNLFVVRPELNRICWEYATEKARNWMGPDEQHLDYRCDQGAS